VPTSSVSGYTMDRSMRLRITTIWPATSHR
jgi:hypothetical protein